MALCNVHTLVSGLFHLASCFHGACCSIYQHIISLRLNNFPLFALPPVLIRLPVDEHLNGFPLTALMNNASVNTGVKDPV